MTQLAAQSPDIDSLIRANRAATPKAAVDARKVPRYSIAELNELDLDTIRDQAFASRFDDRSPVVKVLDLVDLPRNVVANVIYRGSGLVDSGKVRRGAFGLPSISTSDALESLGVKNHLVRGIAGFVGDVALDPLTYLGPAGWGMKVSSEAGRTVGIGKNMAKSLRQGVKDVAARGASSHVEVGPLYEQLINAAPDAIKTGSNEAKAAYVSKRTFGDVTGGPIKQTAKWVGRALGGDRHAVGSVLAESIDEISDLGDAVRKIVEKGGTAAGPGYALGGRGSQIAHIPFTEAAIHTKPFTRAGEAAASDLALAKSKAARPLAEIVAEAGTLSRAASLLPKVQEGYNTLKGHQEQTKAALEGFDKNIAGLVSRGEHPGDLEGLRDRYAIDRQAEFDAIRADLEAKHTEMIDTVERHVADPINPMSPLDVAQLSQWARKQQAEADLVKKGWDATVAENKAFRRLHSEATNNADNALEVPQRIKDHQTWQQQGGPKKAQVEVVNVAADARENEDFLSNVLSGTRGEQIGLPQVRLEIRQIRREIKGLPPDHTERIKLESRINELRSRDMTHDVTAGRISGDGSKQMPPPTYLNSIGDDLLVPNDPVALQRMNETARPILDELDTAIEELRTVKADAKTIPEEAGGLFAERSLGEGGVDAATQAREVQHQAALQNVIGIRQKLVDAMKPYREAHPSQLHTAESSRTTIKQGYLDNLDTFQKHIAYLNETDVKAAEELADATHKLFTAYALAHNAARGSMQNFAHANTLSKKQTQMVEMVQRFLGTDSAIIGRAGFTAPHAMMKELGSPETAAKFNNKAGTFFGTVFGTKNSAVSEAVRMARHMNVAGAKRAASSFMDAAIRDMRSVMDKHDYKPTPETLDKMQAILSALTLRNAQAKGLVETGRETMFTTRFGSKELQPSLKLLEDAAKDGIFGKQTAKLMEELNTVALKYGDGLMMELRDAMKIADPQAALRAGYTPHTLTSEGRGLVARSNRFGAALGKGDTVGNRASLQAAETFEYGRTMDETRFVSQRPGMEGVERRLFRADLDNAAHFAEHPAELETMRLGGPEDAKAADKIQELVEDAREYLAMPNRPHFRNADPMVLNELANEGRFSLMLDGSTPKGGMMEMNFFPAMGDRIMQAKRSEMSAQVAKYLDQPGVTVRDFNVTDVNGQLITTDGAIVKMVDSVTKDGKTSKTAIIGGQRYRALRNDVVGLPDSPMAPFFGKQADKRLYNEEVATAIESLALQFKDDESTQMFFKGMDMLTQQWKNLALLHPGWWIFNMVGDTMNAISRGVNPVHMFNPQFASFNIKVMLANGDPERLSKLSGKINGQTITGNDYWQMLTEHQVIDGSIAHETPIHYLQNKTFVMPSEKTGLGPVERMRLSAMRTDIRDLIRQRGIAAARESDKATFADKAKSVGNVVSDRYLNSFLGPWYRFNQKSSNFIRGQVFMSYLHDGYSAKTAAIKTMESQFDYADMTKIEAKWFRRMFPFYAWMKNNGALQLKTLMDHPVYAASFPKLQAMIEEGLNGENSVPLQQRPNWMRSQMALQVGSDPEHRSAVMLGGALPVGDLYQYLTPLAGGPGGLMNFLHYFASSTNPVVGSLYQLGSGRETFSGRSIGADQYSGDLSAAEFLKNQVRPLAEYGPGGKVYKAFGQGVGQGVGRVLLGGRVQDFGEARVHSAKLREYKDRETGIRQAISRSEKNGDKDKSLGARVQLVRLYKKMEDDGFGDDTPAWYRKQFPSVQQQ